MADIDTTYLDEDTDSIKAARPALLEVVQRVNSLSTTSGAGLSGFLASLTYAASTVGRWLKGLLSERVSVGDYLPVGYVTDGSIDYTAEIQAAIAAAQSQGAILRGVPGTFKVTGTGLSVVGDLEFKMGRMIIKNSAGNVLRVSGSRINLSGGTLWSASGGHTVLQAGNVDQCTWNKVTIYQDATGFSLWENAGFNYIDMRHSGGFMRHAPAATVAGFNLVSVGGGINDNVWQAMRTMYSGNYFFHVEATGAVFQYHNAFRDITFEVCNGGGIRLKGVFVYEISNCANWDANVIGPITRNFYQIETNGSGIPSRGVTRQCGRWAGVNDVGVVDLRLPNTSGNTVDGCYNASDTDPFTVDANNGNQVIIATGTTRFLVTNGGASITLDPLYMRLILGDANLYRFAAGVLMTDGALNVGGFLKTGGWTAGNYNALHSANATNVAVEVIHAHATPVGGVSITYTAATPNSTANHFLLAKDSTATRVQLRSNGGLANFSANNVNLSDERWKKDIVPAQSYWEKVKAFEVVTYLYKDQTDVELNLGVIAQQIDSVAPELVDHSGELNGAEGESPTLGIYQTDMQYATLKALQEAMVRIEALESK